MHFRYLRLTFEFEVYVKQNGKKLWAFYSDFVLSAMIDDHAHNHAPKLTQYASLIFSDATVRHDHLYAAKTSFSS